MTHRQRLIDSTNHVQEDVGQYPAIVRAEYEDALITALDDTLIDGRLGAFRRFLDGWGRKVGWDAEVRLMLAHDDEGAWLTVHLLICSLRRMMARYEYSANILLRYGITPPTGMEELRV